MISKTIGIIPRNLIKNKKRTLSIAISIILSIALITSIEILFNGVMSAYVRDIQAVSGNFFACYLKIHHTSVIRLNQDDRMVKQGLISILGYSYIDNKIISLNGMDDGTPAMLAMNLSEGSFPGGDREIIVEKRFISEFYPNVKVGDTINLVFDIEQYDQTTHEITKSKRNFDFLVCGIIDNLRGVYSAEKAAVFISEDAAKKIISPEKMTYNLFFTTSMDSPVKDTIEWFNTKYGDDYKRNYQINYSRVNSMDTYQKSRKLIVLIDMIVALACSLLIYNLINISIAERIKQYGLLKSIGITPNQIKAIVIGEALLLGIILIPVGIMLGINITEFLINVLGGIGSVKLEVDSGSYNVVSIAGAGILSLLLASYKPGRLVSRMSVLEAINDNKNVLKRNKSYEGILTKTLKVKHGFTWKMAYMNLIRNRKRFTATALSIAICVMAFLSINYSINAVNPLNSAKLDAGSDFILWINVSYKNIGFEDDKIKDIEAIKGIREIVKYKYLVAKSQFSEKNMTIAGIEAVKSEDNISVKELANEGIYSVFTHLVGCSKEQMNELRKKIPDNMNGKADNNNYPTVIVFQDKNKENIVNLNPGEKININWRTAEGGKSKDIKGNFVVESVINEIPFKIRMGNTGVILLTEEENISELFGLRGYQKINIYADKHEDINEIEGKLRAVSDSVEDGELDSYIENIKTTKALKGDILIMLYLLFSMIVAFALVNITNSISMNIIIRKQEFGMLRAIGASKNQIKMVVVGEGFIYGITGSILGTVAGLAAAYQIYMKIYGVFEEEIKWEVQPAVIAAVFIAAILITTISTLIPLKKATDMEIIESIRAIE